MKQVCETSFKNRELSAEPKASYQCAFWFLHSICLRYCASHEKVESGHMKCCTCHSKSSWEILRSDLTLQNATGLRKSALWPFNISDELNMSLVLRLPHDMRLCRSSNAPHLPLLFTRDRSSKSVRMLHLKSGIGTMDTLKQDRSTCRRL